jgi:predicted HTH transcriptional regulator
MLESLRQANLEPPRFDDRRSSFHVVFHNHTLMSRVAIAWLNQFATIPLNDRQRLALAYLRQHDHLGNADYRRLTRVDATTAGLELRGLVQEGLAAQAGVGRWTTYSLQAPREVPELFQPPKEEDRILAFVREHGSIRNGECQALLSVGSSRAYLLLKKLEKQKRLVAKGIGKGRRYSLK